MEVSAFLKTYTLLGLGYLAICFDAVTDVLFGKIMCFIIKRPIGFVMGALGLCSPF